MHSPHVYSKVITVLPEHIDELQHVNNVQYLHWMMESAAEHWQSRASVNLMQHLVWVVKTHEINYLGAAKLGDQLLLTTYTGEYTGAGWWRHFSIRQNASTQELVVAKTLFVLLNKASGKPQRIGTEVVQIFIDAV
jgi:acyl-CoA thioester hydrolase